MEISDGYKKTDVGIIPSQWKVQKIKNITNFHKQGYYTQEAYSSNGKYLLLRGTDMQNPNIDLSTTPKINANESDYISYQVIEGDFLFVRSGAIGRYGIAKKGLPKSIFGSYLINFRFNDSIIPEFFGYLYQSEISLKQINSITQGGGNLNINAENIKSLLIPLPPLPEQQAIAEVLSDTDNLIQTLERQIAKKRLIRHGVMQKLLAPKEGWEVKPLGKIVNFVNGKAHEQLIDENGEYIVINSKFISTNGQVRKFSKVNLCPLNAGDITMVMSDIPNGKALAKCFIVPESSKYALNQRICAFKTDTINREFLSFIINRNEYFLAFDSGTGQTNLRKNDVLKCPIPIPPTIEEQYKIASILSDFDKEIERLEQKISKYRNLKQGIMQNLLTGKIRLVKS